MKIKSLVLVLSLVFFMGGTLFAQKNVGANACKMCHNGPAKGDQYNKWKASKHATSATAKDVAGKAECEKCHAPLADFKAEGVSCEVCHGPGSAYKSMAIMKDKAASIKNGLIVPTEATCKACHDASKAPAGHKAIAFDFATAAAKVAHKKP